MYNFGVYIRVTGDDVEQMLNRWIITQLDSDDSQDTMYTPLDPMFPYSNPEVIDEELRTFLLSRGATEEMVVDIHEFLVDNSRVMAIRTTNWTVNNIYPSIIHRYIDDDEVTLTLSTDTLSDDELIKLYSDYDLDSVLYLTEISIPLELYRKLLSLLRRSKAKAQDYYSIIFSLITRYNTLSDPIGGSIYQYSTPSAVLRLLRERLGVTHEAFSSPISFSDISTQVQTDDNDTVDSTGLLDDLISEDIMDEQSRLHVQSYTSLFPDIDERFGSMGDYRDIVGLFNGRDVGIYAYPPFIDTTINTFINLINIQLNRYYRPATIVVALPKAVDIPGHQQLSSSPHIQLTIDLPKAFHYWDTGLYSDISTASTHDTTIYILQNDLAINKYPLPSDFDRMVRRAFITRR